MNSILNQVGADAGRLMVHYLGRGMSLTEAYRNSTTNLLEVVIGFEHWPAFQPFIFGGKEDFERFEPIGGSFQGSNPEIRAWTQTFLPARDADVQSWPTILTGNLK